MPPAEFGGVEVLDVSVTSVGCPSSVMTVHDTPSELVHVVLLVPDLKLTVSEVLTPVASTSPVAVLVSHLILRPSLLSEESVDEPVRTAPVGVILTCAGAVATPMTLSSAMISNTPRRVAIFTILVLSG